MLNNHNPYSRVVGLLLMAVPGLSAAASVEYAITFNQIFFHSNFGARNLEGTLRIDDSVLGPVNAGKNYSPTSTAITQIQELNITLNNSLVYQFNLASTKAIVAPPISVVVRLDQFGEVTDIQGDFTLPGTISEIILGRVGQAGNYVDVQQTNSTTSVLVSSGTYQITRISSVPVPGSLSLLLLSGLALLRRSKVKSNKPMERTLSRCALQRRSSAR